MPSQTPSDPNPDNVAAGGEPQARPAPADLLSTSDDVLNEIELEFEALVSSSETKKVSLTPRRLQTVPTKKGRTPKLGPEHSHQANETLLKIRQADKEDSDGETAVDGGRMQQSLEDFLRTTGPEDFNLNGTHDVKLNLSRRTRRSQRTKHLMSELFRFAIRKPANTRESSSLSRTSSMQSQSLDSPSVSRRQSVGSPQLKKDNDTLFAANGSATLPRSAPALRPSISSLPRRASISSSAATSDQAIITFSPRDLATESSYIAGTPENVAAGDVPGALSDLAMESSAHQPNDEVSEMESLNIAGMPGNVAPSDVPGALSGLPMKMSAGRSDLTVERPTHQSNEEVFKIESTSIAGTPGMVAFNGGPGALIDQAMESSVHQSNEGILPEASGMGGVQTSRPEMTSLPMTAPILSSASNDVQTPHLNGSPLPTTLSMFRSESGDVQTLQNLASPLPTTLPTFPLKTVDVQRPNLKEAPMPGTLTKFPSRSETLHALQAEETPLTRLPSTVVSKSDINQASASRETELPLASPLKRSTSLRHRDDESAAAATSNVVPQSEVVETSISCETEVPVASSLEQSTRDVEPAAAATTNEVPQSDVVQSSASCETEVPVASSLKRSTSLRHRDAEPAAAATINVVQQSEVLQTSVSRETEVPVDSSLEKNTSMRFRDVEPAAATTSNVELHSVTTKLNVRRKAHLRSSSSMPYRRAHLKAGEVPKRYSSLGTHKRTRLAESVGYKTPVPRINDKKLVSPLTAISSGHVTDAAEIVKATEYATSPGAGPREEPENKDSMSVPEKKESVVVPEVIVGSDSSITSSFLAPIEMDWRISIPFPKVEWNHDNALDAKSYTLSPISLLVPAGENTEGLSEWATSPRTVSQSPARVNGPEVGLVSRDQEPMEGEPGAQRKIDKVKMLSPNPGAPYVSPKPDEISRAGAGAAVMREIGRERRKGVSGSGDMFPQTGASPLDDVVAQTCKRLMKENAHLKKQLVEVMKEHELDRQRFERVSLIAYRKLKELMAEKGTLEVEVSYLQESLKEAP